MTEEACGGRGEVLISLTIEPTPGYPICNAVLSFIFLMLVQATTVKCPVAMLKGG